MGIAMQDFALEAYSRKAGEAAHMLHGQARYADHTLYVGYMLHGLPHGEGEPVQREYTGGDAADPRSYAELANYHGAWNAGVKHGTGKLRQRDGVTYTGHFSHDK